MKMNNRWNRFIYRWWAPVYDATVNHLFLPGRKRAMEILALQPGESVLLVGVGTGADLPLLPVGVWATGIDFSPEMLAKARAKLPLPGREIHLIQGDAQESLLKEKTFDAAILNLILSVIPDGKACLRAALLALRPGGRLIIFDKFLPDQGRLTLVRRLLNIFSTVLGTDITRRFAELADGSDCVTLQNDPSILKGTYRLILLRRS